MPSPKEIGAASVAELLTQERREIEVLTVDDDRARLELQPMSRREHARTPIAVLAEAIPLVELGEELCIHTEVVARRERHAALHVGADRLRGRCQRIPRLGVQRRACDDLGAGPDCRGQPGRPVRGGLAVVVREQEHVGAGVASTQIAGRRGPEGTRRPNQASPACARNRGRDGVGVGGAVVGDDDLELGDVFLSLERVQATCKTLRPVASRHDCGDTHHLGKYLPVNANTPTSTRTFDVLLALTESDLRARYGRGPWQLFKWLIDPFALVGVYLLLITFILRRPGEAPGLNIACAVIPFQLVLMTIVNGMGAVQLRGSILRNMAFDRVLIPVSATFTEAVAFSASLTLLVMMMAIYQVVPTFELLWLPVVVLVTLVFAVACAYVAALVGVWIPDVRPLVLSLVRALFFLAPGLVAINEIGGRAQNLVKLNPLSGLFESYRSILLRGDAPSAWELLVPVAWAVVLFAGALPLYIRDQHQFAKVLE
jgi:lipopolysaccharide transport system permease protein